VVVRRHHQRFKRGWFRGEVRWRQTDIGGNSAKPGWQGGMTVPPTVGGGALRPAAVAGDRRRCNGCNDKEEDTVLGLTHYPLPACIMMLADALSIKHRPLVLFDNFDTPILIVHCIFVLMLLLLGQAHSCQRDMAHSGAAKKATVI
jgi:hypothetical protein